MTARIIHTGQTIVDLVMYVDALPDAGADVFASSHMVTAGGGFNVMAAARRDGGSVVYAGAHGTGPFGEIVRAAMQAEGIHITSVREPDLDTGFSVALVDADAERSFVSTTGAECRLTPAHLEAAQARPDDVVYVSGYSLFHQENARTILSWLTTRPVAHRIVVDTSPMIDRIPDDVLHAVVDHAGMWTANEQEARVLAGRLRIDATASLPELASAIAAQTASTIIVRANRDGAWIGSPGHRAVHVEPLNVTAVDTNGAGDAHTGVLCAGIAAGRDLTEIVRRANVAAAIAVTARGPATSPDSETIDRFLATAS